MTAAGIECGMDDTAGKGRASKMELELKKTSLDAYETGGELTLTQEETAETIVPDYLPDIARIIETEGRVFLHSRELRVGRRRYPERCGLRSSTRRKGRAVFGHWTFPSPLPLRATAGLCGLPVLRRTDPDGIPGDQNAQPAQDLHALQAGDGADRISEEYFVCVHGCGRGTGTVRRKAPGAPARRAADPYRGKGFHLFRRDESLAGTGWSGGAAGQPGQRCGIGGKDCRQQADFQRGIPYYSALPHQLQFVLLVFGGTAVLPDHGGGRARRKITPRMSRFS